MLKYCKILFLCVCLQAVFQNGNTASISANVSANLDTEWWKHTVVYELYARSFKDSDNDGNGDIKGMIEKIPTLAEFGIGAVWITPIQKSPMLAAGYDVSNYKEINPMYGTMDDFKKLVKTAHDHGIKIVLDFVPNHTSDQHDWFKKSESGDAQYKDYYVWRQGKNDGPPNNWKNIVSGSSAWTHNSKRDMYYLHQFGKTMPDLNYRNPKVVEEMSSVLTFWMDLGVDGFRMDAVPYLVEDSQFRDNPSSSSQYTEHLPETYDVIYNWRSHIDNYSQSKGGIQRIFMTEAYGSRSKEQLYYGTKDGSRLGAHFSFNFVLIFKKTAADIVNAVVDWLTNLPTIYTSNWVLGNHDQSRVGTRVGSENIDGYNMLMLMLPGVGVTYMGEEIGMVDGSNLVGDSAERTPYQWDSSTNAGFNQGKQGENNITVQAGAAMQTPYQWDDSTNAGFNTGHKTWVPVASNYKTINLKKQLGKDRSHVTIYQKMVKEIRKLDPVKNGKRDIEYTSDDCILVRRQSDQGIVILLFNLGNSGKTETVNVGNYCSSCSSAKIILMSGNSQYNIGDQVTLSKVQIKPHEAIILSATN